ncbi:MAG: hypothetical protein A3H99_06560 [Gallionellales bacterium RIFCSPLOWO2_02_FULL_59_110]|nr:MAG: hypothetical protein A3H99_06560 [Gallionellales bacterium RIFCSPLOWO2_02_FULL_59_110]OGT04113.1 MAG: hypothetical protein A2Z65_00270 [Gallionellales bacterium RIFCSPLOWO2_02_58_13]
MASYVDPTCANHADGEIIRTKTFAGKLTGFVWGDFLHGEFVDNEKKPQSLFIETSDISCFLALHKGENLTVTFNEVCRYIENGAGIYPVEEIIQIKAEKDKFEAGSIKSYSDKDYEHCEKLEKKYTREP